MEIIMEFSEPSLASYYDVNFDHVVQVQYSNPSPSLTRTHSLSCPVPIPPLTSRTTTTTTVKNYWCHLTTNLQPQVPIHNCRCISVLHY